MAHFITDQLCRYAASAPDMIAINVNDEFALTFGDWEQHSNFAAQQLVDKGLMPGQRVGLLYGGTNWTEYAIAYAGVLKAGGTCVHLPTESPDQEILRRMAQTDIVGILHDDTRAVPTGHSIWSMSVPCGKSPVGTAPVSFDPAGSAEIVYSSGTTGLATGVVVPNSNLTVQSAPDAMVATGAVKPMLGSVRLGLTASSTTLNMVLQAKPTPIVLAPPDDARRMGELIEKYQVETVMVTPHIAAQFIATNLAEHADLSSVRTWGSASAFLNGRLAEALMAMSPGSKVLTAYSASEVRPAVLATLVDPTRPDVLGKPGEKTEVIITDEEGDCVQPNVVGRLWMSAKGVKMRVPLDPEAGKAAEQIPGFIPTGDLAWIDCDQVVHLFDRAADAVRGRDGLVSSLKVEHTIQGAAQVTEAAVVGVPFNDDDDQVPVAGLVLCPEVEITEAVLQRLADQVASLGEMELEKRERPAALVVIDRVPRNPLGKPCKPTLLSELEEALGSSLKVEAVRHMDRLDAGHPPFITSIARREQLV